MAQKELREDGARSRASDAETSPFASISATMGWDTFYLVQSVWLAIIDLPAAALESKWDLQARHTLHGMLVEAGFEISSSIVCGS